MRRTRRVLVVVGGIALTLMLGLAISTRGFAGYPEWREARERSAPVRHALREEFGFRLGRVLVSPPPRTSRSADDAGVTAVAFELRGEVDDAAMCFALAALHRAGASLDGVLSATVVRPGQHMAFETLLWEPESGRLLHLAGQERGCSCMVAVSLDGGHHAHAFTSIPAREVVSDVDLKALERYARGDDVPWRDVD